MFIESTLRRHQKSSSFIGLVTAQNSIPLFVLIHLRQAQGVAKKSRRFRCGGGTLLGFSPCRNRRWVTELCGAIQVVDSAACFSKPRTALHFSLAVLE